MKLSDPYPYCPNLKKSLLRAFLISLFVVAFLAFFQPFELSLANSKYKILFIAGYGVVNFLVLFINTMLEHYIVPSVFKERSWKVYKEMLWIAWILFTIGLGNFLYTKLVFNFPESYLLGFLQFQLYTLAVGIFPVIVIVILNYNKQLRKNLELAGRMDEELKEHEKAVSVNTNNINIPAENQKESLQVSLNDLLFIQSEGNYISIFYRNEKEIRRSVLRNTLKNIEEELASCFPPLSKTHRSYIVNLDLVEKIQGNSQGLQLYLPEMDDFIPVSRAYINSIRERLGSTRK
ncbi:MAG: LytTR family DNA-binding domain-containing protein [Bacteroides sp.]|jgi:hypothetical protein|nr:LytTR family DNA-binding domain-containing protein [Bacteroides sp.]